MQRGRVSPNLKSRVHWIPPAPAVHLTGRQPSLCGQIPITDMERWGNPRWFWTEEPVDCSVCQRCFARGHTSARRFDER